ncbi:MYXO-CTERM sorting domain-containing protein [Trujillonella endophytica]|nr:MYXO-CTERM sorting domain-containing protein [Trujillella endophytica]
MGKADGMGKALLGLLLIVVAVEMIAVVVIGAVLVLLGTTQTTLIGVGMMFAAVAAAILSWRFARRRV